ncbi:hypothetical protein B0H14DRAFT_3474850 [Mycena olivaceomarginata]|nr:hypothetical protein B0H14DRAFT_3474850 [Mycena olivaceomarginata]
MRAQLEQMPESVSRKGAKRVKGAWTEADAPPVTREVGFRIVGLGMVPLSVELQHKVLDLILQLDAQCASNATSNPHLLLITSALQLQTQPPSTCDGFVQAMLRCSDLEASAVVNEFKLMLSYIEAAFFIEWWASKKRAAKRNQLQCIGQSDGKEVNNERQDPNLAYSRNAPDISSCRNMYIVPLIAACGLRTAICKTDYFDLIEKLGYYLCRPNGKCSKLDCGAITKELILPQMVWLKQMTSHLTETFCLRFPPNLQGETERIRFSDVGAMQRRLRAFDYNYFALPALDSCYSILETSLLVPALPLRVWDFDIDESFLAEEATAFHAGGVKQSESYLCIPTEIAEG